MLVLHPERDDLVIAMERPVDADTAIRKLEGRERRRRIREEREGNGCGDDHEPEEGVAEEDAERRAAYRDDAERPEPVGSALDEFMLVRAPAQDVSLRRH